jgi:outer membrane protein OmpA-like peptidoglycan-associated protein
VAGGSAKVARWIGIILIALLLVGGAAAALMYAKKKLEEPAKPTPGGLGVATPPRGTDVGPKVPKGATPPLIPTEPTVVKPSVVQNPDTSLQNEQNRRVREDVLKRIDVMPNITPANKDKLYNSVQRARGMGMILQIPFGSGKTALNQAEIGALKSALEDPKIMRLRDDPTAVFVVLGYADNKGDDAKNIAVSQSRADSVVNAMRNVAQVANVTHAVAMGGSTLHDPQSLDRNRVVEVWAVLP